MSDKSSQNDPSMVEILGSIRRIINEDNAETDTAEAPPDGDEEILDLTDEVGGDEAGDPIPDSATDEADAAEPESEPEVRREPIFGLRSPAQQDGDPATEQPDAASEPSAEEVFEADQQDMDAMADDGAIMQEPEEMAREPMAPEPMAPQQEITPEPAFQPPTPTPPMASLLPTPVDPEKISRVVVSEATTTATATALGELNRAMDEKANQLKVGPEGTTVSDMVKELLRPMLREWLDENLPTIVERIVRREIQKLVDHAEPDD